jgi:hypothetical protein
MLQMLWGQEGHSLIENQPLIKKTWSYLGLWETRNHASADD